MLLSTAKSLGSLRRPLNTNGDPRSLCDISTTANHPHHHHNHQCHQVMASNQSKIEFWHIIKIKHAGWFYKAIVPRGILVTHSLYSGISSSGSGFWGSWCFSMFLTQICLFECVIGSSIGSCCQASG